MSAEHSRSQQQFKSHDPLVISHMQVPKAVLATNYSVTSVLLTRLSFMVYSLLSPPAYASCCKFSVDKSSIVVNAVYLILKFEFKF